MKSYKFIRINPEYQTVTVLLGIDDRTLQQDVPVKDFDDVDSIKEAVLPFLDKFEEDLGKVKPIETAQEVQDLVDQVFMVEEK